MDLQQRLHKTRENQLRRKAARQDLVLRKSAKRDPDAIGYGLYALFDKDYDTPVHCGLNSISEPFALTLKEVETWLTEPADWQDTWARQKANGEGLILSRSRSQDPNADDHGLYALFDKETGISIRAGESITPDIEHTLTLDEVNDILK